MRFETKWTHCTPAPSLTICAPIPVSVTSKGCLLVRNYVAIDAAEEELTKARNKKSVSR